MMNRRIHPFFYLNYLDDGGIVVAVVVFVVVYLVLFRIITQKN